MKFLRYTTENDAKITDEIIRCLNSKRRVEENDNWRVLSEINWLLDACNERYLSLETPYDFSQISKKEYFLAKCKFLHFLKFTILSVVTNPEWYERNRESLDYNVDVYLQYYLLNELYWKLYKRAELQAYRASYEEERQYIPKKHRNKPSFAKLRANKTNAILSTSKRVNAANILTDEIHKKACELNDCGVAIHNVASRLANYYIHLSERQIRRHLRRSGFSKVSPIKIKKRKL